MRRTRWFLVAFLAILLTGCTRELRSETIVIPDSEDESAQANAGQPFQVRTIYRLPSGISNAPEYAEWDGAEGVVRLSEIRGGEQILERLEPPYESPVELPVPTDVSLYGFTPDGKHAYGLTRSKEGLQYVLYALSDRKTTTIDTFDAQGESIISKRYSWTDNGAYSSYIVYDRKSSRTSIAVYDAIDQEKKRYALPKASDLAQDQKLGGLSVKLSGDGENALLIDYSRGSFRFRAGKLNADGYAGDVYEHTLGDEGLAEWLDNDRIAFAGTDGTLFVYDLRNGATSVLAEGVSFFRLSADRQAIAYSKNGTEIRVAKLQGNNLLNDAAVYKGIVPLWMSWSPDNGKLLIQGRKPYETEPRPATEQSAEAAPLYPLLIIEFQS